MRKIKDFYVARAVEIKVESKRVRSYKELGIVLIDYYGNDMLNIGERYNIINGNISPEELQYFNVLNVDESKKYLYMARRLDSFLMNGKFDDDKKIYRDALLNSVYLKEEEIFRLFALLVPNYYMKENVKILKNA